MKNRKLSKSVAVLAVSLAASFCAGVAMAYVAPPPLDQDGDGWPDRVELNFPFQYGFNYVNGSGDHPGGANTSKMYYTRGTYSGAARGSSSFPTTYTTVIDVYTTLDEFDNTIISDFSFDASEFFDNEDWDDEDEFAIAISIGSARFLDTGYDPNVTGNHITTIGIGAVGEGGAFTGESFDNGFLQDDGLVEVSQYGGMFYFASVDPELYFFAGDAAEDCVITVKLTKWTGYEEIILYWDTLDVASVVD